ncbi:MAG: hypothetical protein IT336_06055 [Thermomicrobiales bacterium]|nr:hypothetical protein [Thermomicrobiales bacterium]
MESGRNGFGTNPTPGNARITFGIGAHQHHERTAESVANQASVRDAVETRQRDVAEHEFDTVIREVSNAYSPSRARNVAQP